jgi:hypothetical protein
VISENGNIRQEGKEYNGMRIFSKTTCAVIIVAGKRKEVKEKSFHWELCFHPSSQPIFYHPKIPPIPRHHAKDTNIIQFIPQSTGIFFLLPKNPFNPALLGVFNGSSSSSSSSSVSLTKLGLALSSSPQTTTNHPISAPSPTHPSISQTTPTAYSSSSTPSHSSHSTPTLLDSTPHSHPPQPSPVSQD